MQSVSVVHGSVILEPIEEVFEVIDVALDRNIKRFRLVVFVSGSSRAAGANGLERRLWSRVLRLGRRRCPGW